MPTYRYCGNRHSDSDSYSDVANAIALWKRNIMYGLTVAQGYCHAPISTERKRLAIVIAVSLRKWYRTIAIAFAEWKRS